MKLFARAINLSVIVISLFFNNLQAATLYRHLPLTVTLDTSTRLVVEYEDTFSHGIRCIANNPTASINFLFKGKEKFAPLPLMLESNHVPVTASEALADASGLFSVMIDKEKSDKNPTIVHCDYADALRA